MNNASLTDYSTFCLMAGAVAASLTTRVGHGCHALLLFVTFAPFSACLRLMRAQELSGQTPIPGMGMRVKRQT